MIFFLVTGSTVVGFILGVVYSVFSEESSIKRFIREHHSFEVTTEELEAAKKKLQTKAVKKDEGKNIKVTTKAIAPKKTPKALIKQKAAKALKKRADKVKKDAERIEFGVKVKKARLSKGISQKALAKLTGCHQVKISTVELGTYKKYEPFKETLEEHLGKIT